MKQRYVVTMVDREENEISCTVYAYDSAGAVEEALCIAPDCKVQSCESEQKRPKLRVIRMVLRRDGNGYRQISESERRRREDLGQIRLEGVDGDDEANTIVYYYIPAVEV